MIRNALDTKVEALLLVVLLCALPLAMGACAAAALGGAAATAAQGVAGVGAVTAINAGEKANDRHTPGTALDQDERCDALVGSAPGVEEVRKNKYDIIESRQWQLVGAVKPHWEMHSGKGASDEGWAPKPHIDKLKFSPPLPDQLDYKKSQFLAYAPNDLDNIDDSRAMTSVSEAFGPPAGTFQWRDKTYGYTLVPQLPCFPAQPQ